MKSLRVALPAELHADLREQAERLGEPTAALVREAIEEWIRLRKREQVADEIRSYAIAMAGTSDDLDEDLEGASVSTWLENSDLIQARVTVPNRPFGG